MELDSEDSKLITLARSARARLDSAAGAAVRDETGRTYVATSVSLPSLSLTAIQAAVVMAVCGGAQRLDAVALVSEAYAPAASDLATIRDLGDSSTSILLADSAGVLRERAYAR